MIRIADYSKDLLFKNGIYYSRNIQDVSYPEDGYNRCFQIEENSFWFNHRNKCIISIVEQYPPRGFLFDVGGGNGFVSLALQKEGFKTILVEPGISGTQNAKSRGLKRIICSAFNNENFISNSLPAVGLFDVLEHIEDDFGFLSLVYKKLKNNGLLYCTVPAYSFLWSAEDVHAGHFRRYSKSILCSKLKKSGFEIEYVTYFFSILPIPIFLFRTIPGLIHSKETIVRDKSCSEHNKGQGALFQKIWEMELKWMERKRSIPFGGSCLVVARKN